MSDCVLSPNEQFFSYIMTRTSYIQWNDDDILCPLRSYLSETLLWFWANQSSLLLLKTTYLGQTKKIISFSGQFLKILKRQGGTFFLAFCCCNNQWQLIPQTTMHAFDINALLTMITINKLTDRTRKNSGNGHKFFFPNVKTINAAVKTRP